MDLISKDLREELEKRLEEVTDFIDKLESKQKLDVTTALTGNLVDFLDFGEYLNDKGMAESLTEEKKKKICEKIVDSAVTKINKLNKNNKVKAAMKSKKELAKLLYEKDLCFKCKEFKCKNVCKKV